MCRCQRGPDEAQRRGDVGVEDLGDRAEIGVHQRPEYGVDRGVVDDDVTAPERLDHRRDGRFGHLGIADRTGDGHDPRAEGLDRGLRLLELGGLAGHDGDVGARGRARLRDRPSDATRAAGDQDRPAVDAQRGCRIDHR